MVLGEKMTTDNSKEEKIPNENNDEHEALNNRFMRLAADFDNYKKRVLKEKEDISKYGNEKLIKELLTVLDNLQLAVDYFDPKGDVNSLVEGVKLVQNQLETTLQKFGLIQVNAQKGTQFDPMLHQAVEKIKKNKTKPDMILNELVKGYILNERLIRPAAVVVSTSAIGSESSNVNKGKSKKGRKKTDQK